MLNSEYLSRWKLFQKTFYDEKVLFLRKIVSERLPCIIEILIVIRTLKKANGKARRHKLSFSGKKSSALPCLRFEALWNAVSEEYACIIFVCSSEHKLSTFCQFIPPQTREGDISCNRHHRVALETMSESFYTPAVADLIVRRTLLLVGL